MQKLRSGVLLQLVKHAQKAQAVSPLPGLCQIPPAVTVLQSDFVASRQSTSLLSLRSFAAAAEPCRIEDPHSAAEALFKAADEHIPAVYQPATFPFFARAYYVGTYQDTVTCAFKQ